MIVPPTTEQLREMSASPCPYWHNHANPPATPASQEHTTEPVTCEDCIHFRRDVINPSAGLGWCELRKVSRYPEQPHYCKQMETEEDEPCGLQ